MLIFWGSVICEEQVQVKLCRGLEGDTQPQMENVSACPFVFWHWYWLCRRNLIYWPDLFRSVLQISEVAWTSDHSCSFYNVLTRLLFEALAFWRCAYPALQVHCPECTAFVCHDDGGRKLSWSLAGLVHYSAELLDDFPLASKIKEQGQNNQPKSPQSYL